METRQSYKSFTDDKSIEDRSDIDEKKTRLEDMDQVLSEGVSSADNLLEQLEELDGVIQTLEDTVEEYESEF